MKLPKLMPLSRSLRLISLSILLALIGACGNSNKSSIATPSNPGVEGPITGNPTLISTFFNLQAQGYEQAEYFINGTAESYSNVNEFAANGKWLIEVNEQADYQTRIVVYRPIDETDFNGTVIVEWLNVSAGFESAPDWNLAHTELIRNGYAWVGVSAQKVGVDDLVDKNAERYSNINHPGDSFSYDIYAQIGQAIHSPQDINPLGSLKAERIIAAGESQSAQRMLTYVNILGNRYDIFDGFLIHSRLGSSSALSQAPQTVIVTPEIVFVRDDLKKPVMMLQTETDLLLLNSYFNRQEDSPTFRLWEVAGTAHADLYTAETGFFDVGTDPSVAAVIEQNAIGFGFLNCEKPVNAGPHHFVVKAAISALNKWIIDGTEPPIADRLIISGEPASFSFDSVGNVEGGIRTPYVDVPIAKLSGTGQSGNGFCFLFGTTELFDSALLGSLYSDNAAYIDAVILATDEAVANGFILETDGELIKSYVQGSDIFGI